MRASTPVEIAPGLFAFSDDAAKRYYVGQQFAYGELAAGIDKVNKHKSSIKELEKGISWTMNVLSGVIKDTSTGQCSLLEEQIEPPDKDQRIAELKDALAKHLQVVDTTINRVAELQQQAVQKDVNINRIMEDFSATKTELKHIAREKDAIITSLRARADGLQKELAKTKKNCDEYQSKFEAADSSVAEIHEDFKRCYDEVHTKLDLVERHASDAEKVLQECKEEHDALKDAENKSERMVREAEETTAHLKRGIQELESEVMAVQRKLDDERDERDEHDETKHTLRAEEKKHDDLKKKFEAVYGNLVECNRALQEINAECDKLNMEIDELVDERNDLAADLEETTKAHEELQRNFNDKAYEVLDAKKDLNIANKKIGELHMQLAERNEMADNETQTEATTADGKFEHKAGKFEVGMTPETAFGKPTKEITPPSTPAAASISGGDSLAGSTRRSSDADEFDTATEYLASASTEEKPDSDVETAREGEGSNDGDASIPENDLNKTRTPAQNLEPTHCAKLTTQEAFNGVAISTTDAASSIGSWSDDYDDYDDATFVPRDFKTRLEPSKSTFTSPSAETCTNGDTSARAKKLYPSENRLFTDTQHMPSIVKLPPQSPHLLVQGKHRNAGYAPPPALAHSISVLNSIPDDALWVTINLSSSPVGKEIFLNANDDMTSISESECGELNDEIDNIYFEEYTPEMYTYEMCASLNAGAPTFVPAFQHVAPHEDRAVVAAALSMVLQDQSSEHVHDFGMETSWSPTSTGSSADSTSIASPPDSSVTDGRAADLPFIPASPPEKNDDASSRGKETSTTVARDPTAQTQEEATDAPDTFKSATLENRNDTVTSEKTEPKPTAKVTQSEVKDTNPAVQSNASAQEADKTAPETPKNKDNAVETKQYPQPRTPEQKTPGHGMLKSKWATEPAKPVAQPAAQTPTTPSASAKKPSGEMAASKWDSATDGSKTPTGPKIANGSRGGNGGGSSGYRGGGRANGVGKGRDRRGY